MNTLTYTKEPPLTAHGNVCFSATSMPEPEDPTKLTHTDLKVAAAAGAQAVASESQKVADALQKKADKAVEKEHPSEGTLDRLRDLAHRTTEEVIQLLKEINSPKE